MLTNGGFYSSEAVLNEPRRACGSGQVTDGQGNQVTDFILKPGVRSVQSLIGWGGSRVLQREFLLAYWDRNC